jgi:DNA-binding transcriptional MocR family regulator
MWNLFNNDSINLKLGCGWLPESWRETEDLSYAIRHVTRMNRTGLLDYSTPLGSLNMRQLVRLRLRLLDMPVDENQILLTTGASHALDLLVRYLTKPGDTVFVESPGYYNLFGLLKLQGVNMVGVPRGQEGPDVDALERLLTTHRPKLFFVNSVLQNPTGTTLSPGVAHRLLQLAERYDFTVVEDDIYADFQAEPSIRLAALDGLKRVIYVSSYSKTLSCSLRVGFIVGGSTLIRSLVDVKMLTSIASSRFAEHVVATMLENGSYRKLLERLRQKMTRQMVSALSLMQGAGWEIFSEPASGMFVWARRPEVASAQEVIHRAAGRGVSLTPGAIFREDTADTPWLRINVTYASDPRAAAFLTDWPAARGAANPAPRAAVAPTPGGRALHWNPSQR